MINVENIVMVAMLSTTTWFFVDRILKGAIYELPFLRDLDGAYKSLFTMVVAFFVAYGQALVFDGSVLFNSTSYIVNIIMTSAVISTGASGVEAIMEALTKSGEKGQEMKLTYEEAMKEHHGVYWTEEDEEGAFDVENEDDGSEEFGGK